MRPPPLPRTFGVWLCLAATFVAAACQAQPASSPAAEPVVWSPQPAAEYLLLVQELASPAMEGRGPGTAGIEKARDYIVRHFKDAGLEPAFSLPAQTAAGAGTPAGKSFTQPFDLRMGLKAEKQSLAVLDSRGQALFEGKPAQDFSATGFSPDSNFRGQAVWVGYGISSPQADYDNYGDANLSDLKGKVAVAFRYEPQDSNGRSLWARTGSSAWSQAASLPNKAQWAASRGAVAILIVNPPSQDQDKTLRGAEETGWRIGGRIPLFHITTDALRRVLLAAGEDGGDAAIRRLQEQADRSASPPRPLGDIVIAGQVSLKTHSVTVHNVAGFLPGRGELANEVIVIGAHYDHLGHGPSGSRTGAKALHPGADDNASGTAGVMTLAKWLTRRAAEPNAPGNRRTILFVGFSGEERGLTGSSYMVRNLSQAGIQPQQVVAMIAMDMIGWLRDKKLYALAADTGAEWREMLKAAAKGTGVDVLPTGGGLGGSDHASFYNGLKVPALHIFTGVHGDYHTPRDTADKINAPGAIEVLQVVRNLAEDLWSRPSRLTYVAPKAGTSAAGGPAAYLGIVPDEVTEKANGLPVLSVMPGSPADEAGVRPGDVLLKVNDKPINRFKDLLDALGAAKPGDKVRLFIQRDGKTVEVEAKLGRRGG